MCGIVTYVGKHAAAPTLIDGLKRLEYRGYDSAGVAVLNGDLRGVRAAGKLGELERKGAGPGLVLAARRGSPLVVGVGQGEHLIASDVAALVRHTKQVIYLEDDEVAATTADELKISRLGGGDVRRPPSTIEWSVEDAEKGGHAHFMLKEILEQPDVIRNAQRGRTIPAEGIAKLGGLEGVLDKLRAKRRLPIV